MSGAALQSASMLAPRELPAAVIFDCDGTLVDSEPLARVAWERTLAAHGYRLVDADLEHVLGLPYPVVHRYFAERAGGRLPGADTLYPVLTRELLGLFEAQLAPFEDAVATVGELRERGVAVAVASSSARARLEFALGHVGLDGAFAVTVAGDEVARGKPAPDMFLVAARRLGAEPSACVVVEDSAPGVAAGRAAGMGVLGVVRAPGAEAALGEADHVAEAISLAGVLAATR